MIARILYKFKFIQSHMIYRFLKLIHLQAEDDKLQYFYVFLLFGFYWHMATRVKHVDISWNGVSVEDAENLSTMTFNDVDWKCITFMYAINFVYSN